MSARFQDHIAMNCLLYRAPARLGLTRAWRRVHRHTVPVMLLHGVLPDADTSPFNSTGKFISPAKLRCFLERASGIFNIVSATDFVGGMLASRTMDNAMVLTFDDGYANNYVHALPLLNAMGLPFTVFVTTGFLDTQTVLWNDRLEFAVSSASERRLPKGLLPYDCPLGTDCEKRTAIAALKEALKGKPLDHAARDVDRLCEMLGADPAAAELGDVRFMTTAQVRQMAKAGVGIGSHGVSHAILSRESAEQVRAEITQSKMILEAIVGNPVLLFAYPNGRREDFNPAVKHELTEAGYLAGFTTIHGLYMPGDAPFEIRRIAVDGRWTSEEFETRATGILGLLRHRRARLGQ